MDEKLGELERVLRGLLAAHQRLGEAVGQKLIALRAADHRRVTACCELENEQVQAIAELEKRRLTLVAELTLRVEPGAAAPMRLLDLAQRLEEPYRGRLLVLRAELRKEMEEVKRRTGVARQAAQTLLGHMQGLMRTIGAAVTGVGTYSSNGTLPGAALAVSTFHATA